MGADMCRKICQTSAMRIIQEIREKFDFKANTVQMRSLTNIMMKCYVRSVTTNRNFSENKKKLAKFHKIKGVKMVCKKKTKKSAQKKQNKGAQKRGRKNEKKNNTKSNLKRGAKEKRQ